MIANALINLVLLRWLGARVSVGEAMSLAVVTAAGNLLGPMRGGMVARGVYLKRYHDFSYARFSSSLFGPATSLAGWDKKHGNASARLALPRAAF